MFNVQRSLDSFWQGNAITVQRYAHETECALQMNTPLKSSHIHICVYLSIYQSVNRNEDAIAKQYLMLLSNVLHNCVSSVI
jgi:hypothetical protein